MPSLSKSKQLSVRLPIRLLPLSFSIIAALSCSALLTACGGGGSGTTRTPGDGTTTPVEEKSYTLIFHSQVAVKNATIKLIDAQTKKEIASKTLSEGSDFEFSIKESNANGRLLIAELSGQGDQGSYYDPTLNRWAPFTGSLHATQFMVNDDRQTVINPFTEITYQRALVRAGSMDRDNPTPALISATSSLTATSEVLTTFGVNPAHLTLPIAKQADLNKLIYDSSVENAPNTPDQYFNTFMSIGHYMVQKNENSGDLSPYLTFTKRAAEDMRDGSLDGYTIVGDGTDNTTNSNRLTNPIVPIAKENTFPELPFNTVLDIAELQKSTRENYATRLKNKGVLSFFNTLPQKDPVGVSFFTAFNYLEGSSNSRAISAFKLHSFGAGNYKRAFGINPVIIKKEQAAIIYDGQCQGKTESNLSKTDDKIVNPDCTIGLNADGTLSNAFNDIERLVGKYTSTDGCELNITFDGQITLKKGTQSLSTTVNRDESDALIRLPPNTQSYIMNITSSGKTPPDIIQLRMEKHTILSAVAGATNAVHPTSLMPSEQKFSCNFS